MSQSIARAGIALALAASGSFVLTAGVLAAPLPAGPGSGALAVVAHNVANHLLTQATPVGPADPAATTTIQVALNWRHASELAQLITAQYTPNSPQYHHFLTPAAFAARFGPTAADVRQVTDFLQSRGLTVLAVAPNRALITASGTYASIAAAFHVSLARYRYRGQTFVANRYNPEVPAALAPLIAGINGLTTYHDFKPALASSTRLSPGQTGSTGPVGYSPQQIAAAYDASPLYQQNHTGQGTTIAIATLASFQPSDAQYFWNYYGIARTGQGPSVIPVDGGFTSTGGDSGPGSGRIETTLDVERSGAMAPGANLLVYEAPNTIQGFVDLFNAVVSQDRAQVMTCSWGESEVLATPAVAYEINRIFMEGAAQGQSLFAASGDYGAYDGYPLIPAPTVDFPASSPYITAVGGTTRPIDGQIAIPNGSIPMGSEHGWGWSYLLPYYANFGFATEAQFLAAVFPIGSGGGVSHFFAKPWYQLGRGLPPTAGRMVPDVALNADPFTGYAIYDTAPGTPYGTGWLNGWGGTSFASPQWAGFMAVIDSAVHADIGFANPLLYQLYATHQQTATPPFFQIWKGNNWLYRDNGEYSMVTGLGTPDLANLVHDLARP